MRYAKYRNVPKGEIRTYYQSGVLAAQETGLSISNMVATVESGSSISVHSQAYASQQLAYQLKANSAGNSVVRITVTFTDSQEKYVTDYLYRVFDTTTVRDYA